MFCLTLTITLDNYIISKNKSKKGETNGKKSNGIRM